MMSSTTLKRSILPHHGTKILMNLRRTMKSVYKTWKIISKVLIKKHSSFSSYAEGTVC